MIGNDIGVDVPDFGQQYPQGSFGTLEIRWCSTAEVVHSGEMLVHTVKPGELFVCA